MEPFCPPKGQGFFLFFCFLFFVFFPPFFRFFFFPTHCPLHFAHAYCLQRLARPFAAKGVLLILISASRSDSYSVCPILLLDEETSSIGTHRVYIDTKDAFFRIRGRRVLRTEAMQCMSNRWGVRGRQG